MPRAMNEAAAVVDLTLLQWDAAGRSLRSFFEAVEARIVEWEASGATLPSRLPATPIDKLFGHRLAELRALRKALKS